MARLAAGKPEKMAAPFLHCGIETLLWGTKGVAILDQGRCPYGRDGLRPWETCRRRYVFREAAVTVDKAEVL